MKEQDPIGNDHRRVKREDRLGPDRICIDCGYARPEGLRPLLEAHHVMGRANDPALTILLCRNCHAEITEDYRVHGVSMAPPVNALTRAIASLGALAIFFRGLSVSCARMADELQEWWDTHATNGS